VGAVSKTIYLVRHELHNASRFQGTNLDVQFAHLFVDDTTNS
jgi:hypothetical protein